MRRRHQEVEADDRDRWLISYADFITLLFGFFVVMYAVSSVNEGKYRVVSESMVAAFRSPQRSMEPIQVGRLARSPHRDDVSIRETPTVIIPTRIPLLVEPVRIAATKRLPKLVVRESSESRSPTTDSTQSCPTTSVGSCEATPSRIEVWQFPEEPEDLMLQADAARTLPRPLQAAAQVAPQETLVTAGDGRGDVEAMRGLEASRIAAELSNALPGLVERGEVSIRFSREAAEIEIASGLLFDSASATMDSEALPILSRLAGALHALENEIRVEGFTDNRPIKTQIYPSNWELSAARAASVVHQFSRLGLDPQRMAAVGYGEHRPIAPNHTLAGRKRNRRVLILVLAGAQRETGEVASVATRSLGGRS